MHHNNVQDHRDECCVIHGCRYGDFDCPVYEGHVPKNKKQPCLICEGTYKDDVKIVYEIIDTSPKQTIFFDTITRLRTFMTKLIKDGYGTNYRRVSDATSEVVEYRMVPIRRVPLLRYKLEHQINKRFK